MFLRHGVCKGARILTKVRLSRTPFCVFNREPFRVIHDRQQRRFTIRLEDGGEVQTAVLQYSHRSDGTVHLISTEVPECFRGKGVAASLAKAALDFVVDERLKASISCWYIKKYVDEHPHHGYQVYIEG